MADAILSAAVGQIFGLLEEQARYHVNLVRGAEKEVCSLAKELKIVRNVLDDAESRRFKDKNVDYWLSRLEQTSYQMEDVLDEWNYAILKLKIAEHDDDVVDPPKQKVCSFIPSSSCLCFKKAAVRHDVAKKILSVKAQLDEILQEKDRYKFEVSQPATTDDPLPKLFPIQSTSLIDLAKVHGRDGDRDSLVNKVLDDSGGIHVLSIVGVGGLGKTTLAQLVFNDSRVEKSFDMRIWVCVSNPFDINVICKGILESIKNGSCPNTDRLDVLLKRVIEGLSGKRFFLVLDDVWTEDYKNWEPLEDSFKSCGRAGSKILVTTRNEKVAKMMGSKEREICHPGLLSEEDCWSILCRMALSDRNEMQYKEVGMKIVRKCDGLPLAIKTLGSLLRFKKNLQEWEDVVNSEIWEMKEAEVDLFPHLLLTYNELSATHKRCFSYCAVFPKDSEIVVESLIADWMALGYLGSDNSEMELKGRGCFDVLAMRSLFQDFVKDDMDEVQSCKMHDIVHDFAQFLRKGSRVEATEMDKVTCGVCDPSFVSKVNSFCHLDCYEDKYPSNSCSCLVRLRMLSLTEQSFPQGTIKLIHLRSLNLFSVDQLSCEDFKIIFQLYNLQTLILSCCDVEKIPGEIKNLIYLRHLELSKNDSLEELPAEIGTLMCLRRLEISKNKSLKRLPSEIKNLIQLRLLELRENSSVEELPKERGNLINLRDFIVSSNVCLKELPNEIGNLINLRRLNLERNESLKEVPNEIGNLGNLQELNLSSNRFLKKLPNEIGKLINLKSLNLGWNESVEELPKEIGNLINLQDLNLSTNTSLEELPSEVGNLINLRCLNLAWNEYLKELQKEIGNLVNLQKLDLTSNKSLKELPNEIGNLINLQDLDLKLNMSLLRLPNEIGNLVELRRFDLTWTWFLEELPQQIGNLILLREFILVGCESLKELPESIGGFQQLQVLDVGGCKSLCKLPQGFAQLTSLHSLEGEFKGGSGRSNLGLLKKLNQLRGELTLSIKLDGGDSDLEGIVKDAREAKLKKKKHLWSINLKFEDEILDDSSSINSVRMDVLDALEPHPNLEYLYIWNYKGSKVAMGWMVSPQNQLKSLHLNYFHHLTCLPPLGRLPCLEQLLFRGMSSLRFVGRELIGEGEEESNDHLRLVAFPKLKELVFESCPEWKQWEDITEEEEASIMPCLTTLDIRECNALSILPHHLLRKASSLGKIKIRKSSELARSYREKDGLHWESISLNNPNLHLEII